MSDLNAPVAATPALSADSHPSALALTHIAKRFGNAVALRDATLVVQPGSLHGLLGENGAGKSTLLHVAFGHLRPDAGQVTVDGLAHDFGSPADAIRAGLGMVHQHFRLVPAMTVAENVALGRPGRRLALERVAEEIRAVGEESGLRVDPDARVSTLGVAAQQRVEIVKALLRGARVLILDEPTAVLAPSEAVELLAWVRRYVDRGNAAVLITHKLREALGVADMVTVLRRGDSVLTASARSVDERSLIEAMIGTSTLSEAAGAGVGAGAGGVEAADDLARGAPPEEHDPAAAAGSRHPTTAQPIQATPAVPDSPAVRAHRPVVMSLRDVGYRDATGVTRLASVTLDVHAGEILGVAGVEGAGQHELMRLLAGRLSPTSGEAVLPSTIGFVPEDRQRDALALSRSLVDNVVLRDAGQLHGRVRWSTERARTDALLSAYDVRGGTSLTLASSLSGGNQQKLVLARELDGDPPALVVESPTRGLDVHAGAAVIDRLRAARARGVGVAVYSSDLDELLLLADRVVVAYDGGVQEVPVTREAIGQALVGAY